LHAEGILVLHDRAIPGSPANVDHIAVTATGVWVIDAKEYSGLIKVVNDGFLFWSDYRFTVKGRNRTDLAEKVGWQADRVRAALGGEFSEVPIFGALCFVNGEFPLIGGGGTVKGVHVCWPKGLCKLLREDGPVVPETRVALRAALDAGLRRK
jgi:hypothetical protein